MTDTVKALRARWVEALRSGRYRQGKQRLKLTDAGGNISYCCLGVACDIVDPTKWALTYGPRFWSYGADTIMLPDSIERLYGLTHKDQQELMALNDSDKTFDTIAAYIESLPLPTPNTP